MTNTTPGAKVNPEHSHPFDVRAMVVKGALTLHRDGASAPTARRDFAMPRGCLHYESYGDGRRGGAVRPQVLSSMTARARRAGRRPLGVPSARLLCSLRPDRWLQNVHIITPTACTRASRPSPGSPTRAPRLDRRTISISRSTARSARLLDALGILRGVPWKQFAYLNAVLGEPRHRRVYAFVHAPAGDWRVAAWTRVPSRLRLRAAAGGDQRGHHAGLRLVLASMLLAGLWFDRPTWRRVIVVGVCSPWAGWSNGG
jgi:hypothetical protein